MRETIKHFQKVYLTNIPSFYKIRLCNEIAKRRSLLVVYMGDDDGYVRNDDFANEDMHFDHKWLTNSGLKGIMELRTLLRQISYDELIISGNSLLTSWYAAFVSDKYKNAQVCESSIYESTTSGIKGFVKRIFIRRFSKCYCPGRPQVDLMYALGFKGECRITQGVGLFNIIRQPQYRQCSEKCNKLLYVGRLSLEKNLHRLINVVARHIEWELTIVGYGPEEQNLKSIEASNVIFLGAKDNKDLPKIYQSADAFILPSTSESWGLVVEEALNNGIPVAVSNRVGCNVDRVCCNKYGVTFSPFNEAEIEKALINILDNEFNNKLRRNIAELDFNKIQTQMIESFL